MAIGTPVNFRKGLAVQEIGSCKPMMFEEMLLDPSVKIEAEAMINSPFSRSIKADAFFYGRCNILV